MLSKNSIFLKILGTFYDQLANSSLVNNIDYVYTSMIMDRYSDILNKSLGMQSEIKFNNVAHAGFLEIDSIDVAEKTGIINDVYGSPITRATIVAIPHIDTFSFVHVSYSDGKYSIPNDLISYASDNGSGKVMIMCYYDYESDYLKSDKITISAILSSEDLSYIGDNIVKLVQNYLMYKPRTVNTLIKVVNLMIGSLFSKTKETVVSISSTEIITNKNVYLYDELSHGQVLVSENDIVDAGELLTAIATIEIGGTSIGEVEKISAYIASRNLAMSNNNYLKKLSGAASRRIFKVKIPSTVLTYREISSMSSINLISRIMPTQVFIPVVLEQQDDGIIGNAEFSVALRGVSVVLGTESMFVSGVRVDGLTSMIGTEEHLIAKDYDTSIVTEDGTFTGDPIIYFDNVEVSENAASIFVSDGLGEAEESQSMNAAQEDYAFVTYSEHTENITGYESVASVDDSDQEMKSGDVILNSTISASDSDKKEISWKVVASVTMDDVYASISKSMESISVYDASDTAGTTYTKETASIDDSKEIFYSVNETSVLSEEFNNSKHTHTDSGLGSYNIEDNKSFGLSRRESLADATDMIYGPMVSAEEIMIGTDEMILDSTTIDEN